MSSQELGRVGENRERSVVIVQRYLTHYRIPFFELLKERRGEEGIRLRLLVGNPTGAELLKGDTSSIPWAEPIKNLYWSIGLKQLVWQRFRHDLRSADLVILEQGSRLLSNAPLLLRRRDKGPLVAFWGHGINRDVDDASRLRLSFAFAQAWDFAELTTDLDDDRLSRATNRSHRCAANEERKDRTQEKTNQHASRCELK